VAIFSCSAAIQKMISLASRQEIAQDTANSYLTCMDVNTDSDDVLYKSKLNIDDLKTCVGHSSLKLKMVSSAHVAFRTESVLPYDWNSLLTVL
jgi:hypothetical protein